MEHFGSEKKINPKALKITDLFSLLTKTCLPSFQVSWDPAKPISVTRHPSHVVHSDLYESVKVTTSQPLSDVPTVPFLFKAAVPSLSIFMLSWVAPPCIGLKDSVVYSVASLAF